ncbi:MAG: cytochrome c oxidase accessory protein CcoG [Rhizobiaceae bacterium]
MVSLLKEKKHGGDEVETLDVKPVNAKENRALYEARKKIHPKRADGFFRQFKWWIMLATLTVYYVTPWLRWDRGAGAPNQAVLLDLENRRFYFFFIEIWPHEFYYIAGLLVMAGIGLFLVTSTLGRAWCGYTCPQTVWVDLFLVVERFFEGDRNARIKLDKAPMSGSKFAKRLSKHFIWIMIAIATGGAWVFYFADAPTLFNALVFGQAATGYYITIAALAASTYIFGGFMREQVCTYMCPWPRIQIAMLDENSLTVTYNSWRGENRARHAKQLRKKGETVGDCVDCNACVAVCPMGIDIRDGQQLECITCALCIDACDSVMEKLGLEKGLIAYSTLNDYTANMQLAGASGSISDIVSSKAYSQIKPERIRNPSGELVDKIKNTSWRSIMRPRTYIYLAIYSAIGLALAVVLANRNTLDVNIIHDRNPLFVTLSDGSIRNGYQIKILNMYGEPRKFRIEVEGLIGAKMKLSGAQGELSEFILVDVEINKMRALKLFVTLPVGKMTSNKMHFSFKVTVDGEDVSSSTAANFEAPEKYSKQ